MDITSPYLYCAAVPRLTKWCVLTTLCRMDDKRVICTDVIPDGIGSTEAARILGTTPTNVCRWTASGYLPARRKAPGSGFGGHVYDRAVVEHLAERRAEARRVLDVRSADWQKANA